VGITDFAIPCTRAVEQKRRELNGNSIARSIAALAVFTGAIGTAFAKDVATMNYASPNQDRGYEQG